MSDQTRVKKLATGSKSPVNIGQEVVHTSSLPKNCLSVINTNNFTEPKNSKQEWSRDEYREVIKSYYTARFFPSRKSNTLETYEARRKKNPTAP